MREAKSVKRDRAIGRGMEFIYQLACDPQNIAEYGSDLLNCFYFISDTSSDALLRRTARRMGRERARAWRRVYRSVQRKADADTIADLMHGAYAATRFGVDCANLKAGLSRAATRFNAIDYLWFDPDTEPPPSDIPEACECGALNPRGRKLCRKCRNGLPLMSRYWVFMDALVRAYTGERYGLPLGSPYSSVIKWLPLMRPYRGYEGGRNLEFYEQIYAVTHVVYTLNDYSVYRLSPAWLPQEYEFLKTSLAEMIMMNDAETTGEIMDSLRAFGLTSRHSLIRTGVDYLLTEQNADGSWGNLEAEDIYQRYHPTWTAIDGLREYRWRGERISFPKLMPLLKTMSG